MRITSALRTSIHLRNFLRRAQPSSAPHFCSTYPAIYLRSISTLPNGAPKPISEDNAVWIEPSSKPQIATETQTDFSPIISSDGTAPGVTPAFIDEGANTFPETAADTTTLPIADGPSSLTAGHVLDATDAVSGSSSAVVGDISTVGVVTASGADPAKASQVTEAAVNVVDPAAAAQLAEAATSSSFSDILLSPAMFLLNTMHDVTGLPWWLAIGAATVLVRTAILPLSVMTMRSSAKMAALQDEISSRRDEVMRAMRSGDQTKATEKQNEMKAFLTNAGASPSKLLLGPLVQFPVFISFFVAVRRLSLSDPSMTTGGAYWFTDLSVADPTYILPVICGLSLAAMTELGGETGQTKISPAMKRALRGMAIVSVPLTYWFPVGVFCYWLPNNLYSVMFSGAMRSKSLRNACGMKINLATIPGTRAYVKANKDAVLNTPISSGKLSAAAAAATYMKKIDQLNVDGSISSNSTVIESEGRPVLLKHRPKKRRGNKRAKNRV